MHSTGDEPFDKQLSCKEQMKSLIPLRGSRINGKRPNAEANTDRNAKIKRGAWDPEGQEPEPRITMQKMILLKKVQEERKQTVDAQHELTRKIAIIKAQLQEVKAKIEKITQDQQTINEHIVGCQDCGTLLKLANQKSTEHRHLMKCIEQEEKLMNELQKTQREICEASVADQAFSLEMEKEIDSIYQMYHSRREFLVKRRMRRESMIEKNARYAHKQTVKDVLNSLSMANKAHETKIHNAKLLSAKTARNKMKKYFRKTMRDREIQMRLLEGDRESKLSNQQRLLGHLKTELDRQKDILWAEHQIKEKKRNQAEAAKESQRKEMLLAGENPYLHEQMLKNAEKNIKIKAKIEKETEEIKKLAQRLGEMNLAKEKEEIKKKKWDKIWAKRLQEKKERDLKKRKEMYGILPQETLIPEEEKPEEEQEDQSVNEKVVQPDNREKTTMKVKRNKGKVGHQKIKHEKLPDTKGDSSTDVLISEGAAVSYNNELFLDEKMPDENRGRVQSGSGSLDFGSASKRSTKSKQSKKRRKSTLGKRGKSAAESEGLKDLMDEDGLSSYKGRPSFKFTDLESFEGELGEVEQRDEEDGEGNGETENYLGYFSEEGDHIDENSIKTKDSRKKNKRKKKKRDMTIMAHAGGDTSLIHSKKHGSNCFHCLPDKISFKDFELGKVYKKKVIVRNISNERLGFNFVEFIDLNPHKVSEENVTALPQQQSLPSMNSRSKTASRDKKDKHKSKHTRKSSSLQQLNNGVAQPLLSATKNLGPSILDLIKISFKAPTPIFPGLHYSFLVTFRPTRLGNWSGKLTFEHKYGGFEIPIECVQKLFVPKLRPEKAVFDGVVAGTSAKMIVKIENLGAKVRNIQRIKPKPNEVPGPEPEPVPEAKKDTDNDLLSPLSSIMSVFSVVEDIIKAEKKMKTNKLSPEKSVKETIPHTHNSINPKNDSEISEEKVPVEKPKSETPPKLPIKSTSKTKKMKNVIKANTDEKKSIAANILDEIITNVTEPVFVAYCAANNKRSLVQGKSRKLCIHFRPPCVDTFSSTFEIEFDDPSEENVILEVVGVAVENPVIFDPMNTNLKICMIDHNYQQSINVTHPLKGCGKVNAAVPPALKNYVSVYPKEASVFNYQPSQFSVKFHPTLRMIEDRDISEFFDKANGIIDFPVYFHLNFPLDLPSPIITTFLAVVTNTRLKITPTTVDFKKCYAVETVKYEISIYNPSMVVQHIAFVDVPEIITVQPNFGFITLLPFETRTVDILVSVTETQEGDRTYYLKCQTLERQEQIITVRLRAKPNSVQLSQTRILFPATCVGSVANTCIDVVSTAPLIKARNNSPTALAHKFFFKIEEDIPIEIRPHSGFIELGGFVSVVVSYNAIITKQDIKEHLLRESEKAFIAQKGLISYELENVMKMIHYEMEEAVVEEEEEVELQGESNSSISKRKKSSLKNKTEKSKSTDNLGIESSKVSGKKTKEKSVRASKTSKKAAEKSQTQRKDSERRKSKAGSRVAKPRSKGLSMDSQASQRSEQKISAKERRILELEYRRDHLLQLLQQEFVPPDTDSIPVNGPEYQRAHLMLMQHTKPCSSIYTLPCYIYDSSGDIEVLLLTVKCGMIHPDIILLNDSPVVDFGAVCLGNHAIREFKFANVSGRTHKLKMDIFNPYGPFMQCNALRKMEPNDIFTLRVRFKPLDFLEAEECIFLFGGDSKIQLTMRGHAVIPQFYINPLKSQIFIGTIQAQSVGSYQFEVINPSEGDIPFYLELSSIGPFMGKLSIEMNEEEAEEDDEEMPPAPPTTGVETPPNTTTVHNDGSVIPHNKNHPSTNSNATSGRSGSANSKDTKHKNRRKSSERSRRSTLRSPRHSEESAPPEDLPITPPPFVGPFEITEDGHTKLLHLREMLEFLEEEKQPVFFQAVPSKLIVKAMSTEKFIVYFIPVVPGSYFGEFKIILFGNVVHEFTVVGVATRMKSFYGGNADE